ncbi:MAG: YhgE/Pip domain-containing protein [Lachnospiraceae bacterium]|nr:YhgE/Pip domain-containing protein [Lachnospiraceae bacterium]
MKNIFRIFMHDAKRLYTNVVAVVVIMGLAVIPSLYAWFNTLSNWDPYSESATSNISVAVASDDIGISIDDAKLNIGDKIIANLKENKAIHWVFTDTSEDAINGVYSGEYYAALVVNERFSEDMISFLGGDINNPVIHYYENEKKNAIAPKITGKVKTSIQTEVDKAFVSTLAKILLEVSEYAISDNQGTNLTNTALNKLYDLDGDITTCITIIDSYVSLIDSAGAVMDAAKEVTDELDALKETGKSMADAAQATTNVAENTVDTVSDIATQTMNQTEGKLSLLYDEMNELYNSINLNTNITDKQIDSIITAQEAIKNAYDLGIKNVRNTNPTISSDAAKVDADMDKISSDLNSLKPLPSMTLEDARNAIDATRADIDACRNGIKTLSRNYTYSVKPQLRQSVNSVENSLLEVKNLLNYSSDSINDLANILQSYPDMMKLGKGNLLSTRAEVVKMQTGLRDLIKDMEDLENNEQYQLLAKIIETDPEIIADFIVEPVSLDKQPIFPMQTNGDATAPFYIVLSIWFGALILVAIMKTKVKPIVGLMNVKPYQEFFGRYVLFFLMGQLQTIITYAGCMFYVQINCEHPVLLYIGCAFTSFSFTFLLYSLTYAFGSVGEAICVVLMVIQVAGSGGTFPVEVLPGFFQVLYKYMPFAYGLSALREAIGGLYKYDFLWALVGLLAYVLVSFLIGLIGMRGKKFEAFIERKLEEQDVIG